jgi:hypothetical protein
MEADGTSDRRDRPNWRTRYLHTNGLFAQRCARILQKLLRAVRAADAEKENGPGILKGISGSQLAVRCVEHHVVKPGGALPDPTHFDSGSLLTIDVMLADPAAGDFEGGELCTLERDGAPSPGADVAGMSPAQSRRRCGWGEPGPGADVACVGELCTLESMLQFRL